MVTKSYISSVRNYPYPSTIEVFFSHTMVDNAALRNTNSYSLDHGAYVTSVEVVDAEMVRLSTENLFGYEEFTLTITSTFIESVDGYAIDNSITGTVTIQNPDEGLYAISAANGRLKSGKDARKVCSDNNFFYIMTESGLDVVFKSSLFNKGYVLNQPGFNTIYIGGNDED